MHHLRWAYAVSVVATAAMLALLLVSCAGVGAGHIVCYKLTGEVMYEADADGAYVDSNGSWRVRVDGDTVIVTGDCVYEVGAK